MHAKMQPSVSTAPPSSSQRHSLATANLPALSRALLEVSQGDLDRVVELLLETHAAGRRVYIMGNGGSAATAIHLANDFMKTAHVPGQNALRAFALVENVALLTAWANDMTYEEGFARHLAAVLDPEDVVVAISASGNSPNILEGLKAARACGAGTVGLLGFDGGLAHGLVDHAIHVPSRDYGLVEDAHVAIGHAISTA